MHFNYGSSAFVGAKLSIIKIRQFVVFFCAGGTCFFLVVFLYYVLVRFFVLHCLLCFELFSIALLSFAAFVLFGLFYFALFCFVFCLFVY